MSGILLFIVAVVLLGVAIFSLVSYVKDRRSAQLPTHKKKKKYVLTILTFCPCYLLPSA